MTQPASRRTRLPRVPDRYVAAAATISILIVTHAFGLAVVTVQDVVSATGADQTRGNSTMPLWIFGLIIIESLLLVAGYRLYQRLSDRWQTIIRLLLVLGIYLVAVQVTYLIAGWGGVAIAGVLLAAASLAVRWDVYWILHNIGAVSAAILGAILIGTLLGPWPLVTLLALLVVWDYAAVTQTSLMKSIVQFAASTNLPAYIVYPRRARLDLDTVNNALKGHDNKTEMPPAVAGIIGTGDFVFPTALTISTATTVSQSGGGLVDLLIVAPFIGTLVGAGMLWLYHHEGATPGLPALNGGAVAGFIVAIVAVGGLPA